MLSPMGLARASKPAKQMRRRNLLARLIVGIGVTILVAGCRTSGPSSDDAVPADFEFDLGERSWPGEREATQAIAQAITAKIEKSYAPRSLARRDAHPRAHGCVRARFEVEDSLPPAFAQGVLQPSTRYAAWIRFSNGASDPTRPDGAGDARGMAIKLTGVPGPKLLADEQGTQDFILINHPAFFIDDPQRYAVFFRRLNSSNPLVRLAAPLALGFRGAAMAREIAASQIANPLYARYFSMVPYRLGNEVSKQAVKFSARPCIARDNEPEEEAAKDPTFLRKAMRATLEQDDACFEFLVQPRTSPSMSVERSMIEWKESEAPFHKVATITIPKQSFDLPAQHEFCENLSFSPWHARSEHRPLGVVNRVRRVVYDTISGVRHERNSERRLEPTGNETF